MAANTTPQPAGSLVWKVPIVALYVAMIALSAAGALYSLYVLVLGSIVFTWMFVFYAGIPAVLNIVPLVLASRVLTIQTWRRRMYRPRFWLPALIALPILFYGNYLFVQSLIGW